MENIHPGSETTTKTLLEPSDIKAHIDAMMASFSKGGGKGLVNYLDSCD
jgi:hypothetical protein